MAIKNPVELKLAISIAAITPSDTKKYFDIIWDIHKYKWYNWYQNQHIKKNSPEDKENTEIFKDLESKFPNIHKSVEDNIDFEIQKINGSLDN
jgi:hypothetical protein